MKHLDLWRDLAYGFRLFRRSPAFYLLGVLIISLGVGATTTIFSLINGVLLNALPYRDSGRLTVIWSDFSRQNGANRALTAPALFFGWRERSRSFQSMAAFVVTNRTFTALDQPITSLTHEVTPNFFDVAGVQVLRGRTFLPDEGLPCHSLPRSSPKVWYKRATFATACQQFRTRSTSAPASPDLPSKVAIHVANPCRTIGGTDGCICGY